MNKTSSARKEHHPQFVTRNGFVYCGECGTTLHPEATTRDLAGYHRRSCRAAIEVSLNEIVSACRHAAGIVSAYGRRSVLLETTLDHANAALREWLDNG